MATEQNLDTLSFPVDVDSSSLQYRAMTLNSDGELAVPSAGGSIVGVLQNAPDTAGQPGSIATGGRTKIVAGEALDPGDVLTPGTSGVFVVCATGDLPCGTCCETAGASGDIVSMIVTPHLAAPE